MLISLLFLVQTFCFPFVLFQNIGNRLSFREDWTKTSCNSTRVVVWQCFRVLSVVWGTRTKRNCFLDGCFDSVWPGLSFTVHSFYILFVITTLICFSIYSKSTSSGAHSWLKNLTLTLHTPLCVYRGNPLSLRFRLELAHQLSQRAQHDRLSLSDLLELRSYIVIQTIHFAIWFVRAGGQATRDLYFTFTISRCLRYWARFLEQRALVRGGFLLHFKCDWLSPQSNRNRVSSVRRSCVQSPTLLAPRSTWARQYQSSRAAFPPRCMFSYTKRYGSELHSTHSRLRNP